MARAAPHQGAVARGDRVRVPDVCRCDVLLPAWAWFAARCAANARPARGQGLNLGEHLERNYGRSQSLSSR